MAKRNTTDQGAKSSRDDVLDFPDDWKELIEELNGPASPARSDDEGMTMQEIAAALGCARSTASVRVQHKLDSGRMAKGSRSVERRDGSRHPVPVYRLVKEKR